MTFIQTLKPFALNSDRISLTESAFLLRMFLFRGVAYNVKQNFRNYRFDPCPDYNLHMLDIRFLQYYLFEFYEF